MKRNHVLAMVLLLGLAVAWTGEVIATPGCGSCGPAITAKKACCPKGMPLEKQCAKCQLKAKAKGCGTCTTGKDCKKCPAKEAGAGEATKPDGNSISTKALQALLNSAVELRVLDARGGKWDDGRRLPGAKGLPSNSDEKLILKVAGPKDGLVVTYCTNLKCGASAALAKRLGELGYKNVIEYPFGIDGWADAGLAVTKTK
jgi:rhodanese-related sulfurtransferase